jgi:Domain of unknown function (DUF4345)
MSLRAFEKLFLSFNALLFVALGVSGLLDPARHMAVFDVALTGPSILAEIRASYGGAHLGLGMLFALGLTPTWRRAALLALVLFVGGLAFGRTVAWCVGDRPNDLVLAFIPIEWLGAALAFVLLRRAAA